MSKYPDILFSVTLRHLSPDGKQAGAEVPAAQLHHLSVRQLRTLLDAAAKVAPSVVYPAEPDIRIEGEPGKFVVQLRNGTVNFISWSSKVRGAGVMTPAQIVAAIVGDDDGGGVATVATAPSASGGSSGGGGSMRTTTIMIYVIAIIAVNAFTFLWISQPPRTLKHDYQVMEAAPAERLLAEVAGNYETGGPDERRLEIRKDGSVHRVKFGAARKIVQNQEFTVTPAKAGGQPALVTSRRSLITITDPTSVVLYGDTYRRVSQ